MRTEAVEPWRNWAVRLGPQSLLVRVMPKEEKIELEGLVKEALPNAMFRVEIAGAKLILATISGKMRMNHIKILPGDRVRLELSPYDLTRGRITYRER